MTAERTDRELLELAAKASGEWPESWHNSEAYFTGVLSRWNPLEDDGDALRLAVKMRMEIRVMGLAVYVGCGPFEICVPVTDGHAKAARLGIVKIAASGADAAMAEGRKQ
jgi:hypothetical protein